MRRWIVAGLILSSSIMLAAGCTSSPPRAYIGDVTSPGCDYIVGSVDGEKPERMKGGYWGVVPCAPEVVVAPGTHTFVLQKGWDPDPASPTITVSATVEANKNYRLVQQGESVSFVEIEGE